MKIKIEADFPALGTKETIKAITDALKRPETAELLQAYSPGDYFSMDNPKGKVTITKL